jgi:hypothetical protein
VQKIVQADESGVKSASRSSLAAQVRAINQRFQTGRPSNELNEAGVFVHTIDWHTQADCFFCSPRDRVTSAPFDRVSGSLINGRVPYIFLGLDSPKFPQDSDNYILAAAGVIYKPQAVAASMRCAFPTDAATDSLNGFLPFEGGCVGKKTGHYDGKDFHQWRRTTSTGWCINATSALFSSHADRRNCARRPQDLAAMMEDQERKNEEILKHDPEGQCKQTCCVLGLKKGPSMKECRLYNEVVLDYELLKQQPDAVEGIYYVTDSAARHEKQAAIGEKLARSFVQQWHKAYGSQVPLMKVRDFNLP